VRPSHHQGSSDSRGAAIAIKALDKLEFEIRGQLQGGVPLGGCAPKPPTDTTPTSTDLDHQRAVPSLAAGLRVGGRFENISQFLDSLRFDNLKASAEARKRIANRIKQLQPVATNTAIARTLGVDKETVRRDLGANAPASPKKVSGIIKKQSEASANAPQPVSGAKAAAIVERKGTSEARRAELKKKILRRVIDQNRIASPTRILLHCGGLPDRGLRLGDTKMGEGSRNDTA
jgi:hypothetical protein